MHRNCIFLLLYLSKALQSAWHTESAQQIFIKPIIQSMKHMVRVRGRVVKQKVGREGRRRDTGVVIHMEYLQNCCWFITPTLK